MKTPLDRLYATKLTLFAVIFTVVGVGLMVVAFTDATSLGWLDFLPLGEIGSALFVTGLIAIFFEYIDRQDADQRANERLRKVLVEEAPAIRDAVVDGFAFKPESLTNVASPAVLDRVVENCLAIQLEDKDLAAESYADLRQLVGSERCYDMNVSVSLAPWEKGPANGPGSMFVATLRWEYKTRLTKPLMRFACVSDMAEYRELLQDPTLNTNAAIFFEPIGGLDGGSTEVFELVQFSMDGKEKKARRTTKTGSQVYTVNLGEAAVKEPEKRLVTVSYTYRQLVQRHGHLLYVDMGRPTRGVRLESSYADCGIQFMNVLDYVSSHETARIERLPASGPSPSVVVGFDGWVWPKAGVGFVWVLRGEGTG